MKSKESCPALFMAVVSCAVLMTATLLFAGDKDRLPTDVNNPTASQTEKNTMILMKTSKGDIKIKLYDEDSPISVKNFLTYVESGHYNGTIFHRVIDNFMIQGGGFDKKMNQKPTLAPIKNEAANGKKNKRGTLAMARTGVIDSATCQFFINVKDNDFLDYRDPSMQGFGYCVFGEVVDGLDIVDAIKTTKTGRVSGFSDVPVEPIEIIEVTQLAD